MNMVNSNIDTTRSHLQARTNNSRYIFFVRLKRIWLNREDIQTQILCVCKRVFSLDKTKSYTHSVDMKPVMTRQEKSERIQSVENQNVEVPWGTSTRITNIRTWYLVLSVDTNISSASGTQRWSSQGIEHRQLYPRRRVIMKRIENRQDFNVSKIGYTWSWCSILYQSSDISITFVSRSKKQDNGNEEAAVEKSKSLCRLRKILLVNFWASQPRLSASNVTHQRIR